MSVAEVDALLYLPGHDRSEVSRAVRIAALSPGWRDSFAAILAADEGAAGNAGLGSGEAAPPAWSGFRQMRVLELHRESDTVVSVRLSPADGQAPPVALPGQYVALSLRPAGAEAAVVRN